MPCSHSRTPQVSLYFSVCRAPWHMAYPLRQPGSGPSPCEGVVCTSISNISNKAKVHLPSFFLVSMSFTFLRRPTTSLLSGSPRTACCRCFTAESRLPCTHHSPAIDPVRVVL